MTGDTADTLRNLLLNAAVGDESKGFVSHPLAETSHHETLRNGCTQRHGMPLTQRSGGVFDTMFQIQFRVSRSGASPLTKMFEIIQREISSQRQHRIEHRRHMARIEEETITERIGRIIGIIFQKLGIENVDKISSAHGSARVSRLRLLYHRGRQNTDIIRGHCRYIFHLIWFRFKLVYLLICILLTMS